MAKKQVVEAVGQTMQDITYEKLPFGGKIMVMGGDFRQVLPIVRRGTRAQIVESSLRMSPLWASVKRLRLIINMRALLLVGQHARKRVFLPRILLCPSDDEMFPFKLKRKQFPVQLSFSMINNKAQGQTIPNVGVYLPESVFSHGQLYVASSRGISRVNTKVLVKTEKTFDNDGIYTSDVVYKKVLCD
ncbi:uncharacterized protein LOC111912409 [Lactuca sativa]|uniref:uncharacterized protein LOC111912409 n=1 Tax=Lactuca sativa TaxID=4236 RepID=UPI0022AFCBBA|nr:uncharacterized protein LOC111912409 [Lactuca sativa]